MSKQMLEQAIVMAWKSGLWREPVFRKAFHLEHFLWVVSHSGLPALFEVITSAKEDM